MKAKFEAIVPLESSSLTAFIYEKEKFDFPIC